MAGILDGSVGIDDVESTISAVDELSAIAPRRSTRERRPPTNYFESSETMMDVWGTYELYQDFEEDPHAHLGSPPHPHLHDSGTREMSPPKKKPRNFRRSDSGDFGHSATPTAYDLHVLALKAACGETSSRFADLSSRICAGAAAAELGALSTEQELSLTQRIELKSPVQCLEIHPSGQILAAATILGEIHLFRWADPKWEHFCTLPARISDETVDEIYTLAWSQDGRLLFAAGARKSRNHYDSRDSDLRVLPSPLVAYDLFREDVATSRYEVAAHAEEVLCLVSLSFNGTSYLLSCGQDGYVLKWRVGTEPGDPPLVGSPTRFADNTTWLAFDIAVLPNCSNRFFLLAADDGLKLFDFESEIVVASWPRLYSATCDALRIFAAPAPLDAGWLFVSHGTEAGESPTVPIHVRLLLPPTSNVGTPPNVNNGWGLRLLGTLEHPLQLSNAWPLHVDATATNVFVPTTSGKVLVWDIRSRQLCGILADHMQAKGAAFRGGGGGTVRSVVLARTVSALLTCSEDGDVCVYSGRPALTKQTRTAKVTRPPAPQFDEGTRKKRGRPRKSTGEKGLDGEAVPIAAPVIESLRHLSTEQLEAVEQFILQQKQQLLAVNTKQ